MLPLFAVGESTTVAPSPPKPSSEDTVPGTEMLCLRRILVGMLRKLPITLVLIILGGVSHALAQHRASARAASQVGTDGRHAGCEETGHELVSNPQPLVAWKAAHALVPSSGRRFQGAGL